MISNKKYTTEEFVEKSKSIFEDLYDYTKVKYVGNKIKVEIVCKVHGSFLIRPNDHLTRKTGCQKCNRIKTGLINRNRNWLNDFKSIHFNRYDYSKVNYVSNKIKVEIICKEHGSFFMKPNAHTGQKQGCPKCSKKYIDKKTFIDISTLIHKDKYDYSKVEYIDSHTKVEIICDEHGIFKMKPTDNINNKQGCPKCGKVSMSNKNRKNIDLLISQFKELNGELYDYSKVFYKNNNTKIEIMCKEHGLFLQTPKSHMRGDGCPKCSLSKGERKIMMYFDELNLNYEYNFIFNDCRDKNPLPFDFYLSDYKICIEYDGEQHFKPIEYFGGIESFSKLKVRDKIKNDYCLSNSIKLIRIPFNKYDEIENILISNHII